LPQLGFLAPDRSGFSNHTINRLSAGLRAVILDAMSEVTRVLSAIEQGDPHAAAQLLPLVYDELRQLAAGKLAHEQPGQTLQATALVHEAYLRLVASPGRESGNSKQDWNGRGHFFAAAAEAMRRILIDRARHKQTKKAGGGRRRLDLVDIEPALEDADGDRLLALDEALRQLEAEDPRKAELVKLRFFAGLTGEQAAAALGVSTSTADKDWAYARSWLRVAIDRMSGHRP
jgi:RNA polymerase sigma factor (TIGR02999 family)